MKEQNAQQQEKLKEIKNRATTIRRRHEELIRRSGGEAFVSPGSYAHGMLILLITPETYNF